MVQDGRRSVGSPVERYTGVLKVQGTNLDMAYLQLWAVALKVSDLLERALIDADLAESK